MSQAANATKAGKLTKSAQIKKKNWKRVSITRYSCIGRSERGSKK
jgi:hypothetical protein